MNDEIMELNSLQIARAKARWQDNWVCDSHQTRASFSILKEVGIDIADFIMIELFSWMIFLRTSKADMRSIIQDLIDSNVVILSKKE